MSRRRFAPLGLILALSATAIVPIAGSIVLADTYTEGFESFTLGTPDGQSGWQADGSAGSGCATYDHAIATTSVPGFGSKALRISNAVTSSCFSDQTFSASLVDEAGEASAQSDGYSGGTRQRHFEAEWQFASTVPGAEQPGLAVTASPDRGDGARMSWIQMADGPTGLAVNFYDYRDEHDDLFDNFYLTNAASGLDRAVPHTIKVSIDFLDGSRNDVARLWVDGTLVHVDTSWEDYFRVEEGNPTRTVDSILFRTAGTAAPATTGNGFFIDNLTVTSGPTLTADSTGAWELYPPQSVTTTATTSTATAYRASVRAPINADGTSNFNKKKGVIPVQFDLESATQTTTTTTTTTGPVVFQSIGTDTDTSNDYSFLSFDPSGDLTFADLNELVADYSFSTGNCHGGSLRWSVGIDTSGDGLTDGRVNVMYGDLPNFTDCSGASSQSGLNMIGSSDARYDLTQLGGPWYGTYADALALVGNEPVTRATLIVDAGWGGDQVVDLTGASVDGADWTPLTAGSTTSTSTTTGAYAKTCALPQARINWRKNDPTPDGGINEAESIQPKDSGEFYRQVDCKYIYNLDVTSLDSNAASRGGTYYVWVNIGGTNLDNPAKFDLK